MHKAGYIDKYMYVNTFVKYNNMATGKLKMAI